MKPAAPASSRGSAAWCRGGQAWDRDDRCDADRGAKRRQRTRSFRVPAAAWPLTGRAELRWARIDRRMI